MSDISKSTADLSPEQKRALLAQLMQKKASDTTSLLPLSLSQQALWFLYKLAPSSWAYNVLIAGQICSDVDVAALQSAFQALSDRHTALRTTYTEHEGKPVQQIHSSGQVYFKQHDASAWSQEELNNRLVEEAHRPFDLEQGPVMRLNLWTKSATDHIFLITGHHIAIDLWSMTVLMDELRVLYPAQKAGTQALLPDLDLQYTDYVRTQSEMLAGAEGERLWNYWQKQLSGELPILNLPTDRPRPPVQTYCGASYGFKLDRELSQQLKALAQTEEATLYMLLLAGFQVLLYRYTGQEDILVGSPTSGRSKREFAAIVGDFINTVVFRANLTGNLTFKAFLTQVRQTVLAALKHQDYPFPLLVERLHPPQDFSRSPLFQVMLIFQKLQRFEELSQFVVPSVANTKVNFGGFEMQPVALPQQEGQMDLTLEMIETSEGICGVLKYNTDLFESATIARMVGHFQTLLQDIVANPEQAIATLPLLTPAERHLLHEWNQTQVDYPQVCIHQLFEAQVERTPDGIAAVFGSEHLTYRQLNAKANQLAHYLSQLGVEPEVKVGICVERSLLMVMGLLGILKAGGAYIPIDPAYPAERIAFMLEDAQLSVLLTQNHLLEALPTHTAKVVCLDADWEKIEQQSQQNLATNVTSENLAYTIYTSGSTGKPKGVQILHRSLVNFITSLERILHLTEQDRLLSVTTITFDIAGLELFLPLTTGARVVVVSREAASDGAQLIELLAKDVTLMQATPATWRLLLEAGWQGNKQLKILCGGEALPRELASELLERGAGVWNLYGPTETTIWSTIDQVKSGSEPIKIGHPIANTQVYVLDKNQQLVPIGVGGELHIGGAGLARGYFNRPELTAEKFIIHNLIDAQPQRLYKTGDLVRYLNDGSLEFLGRIDHQVKIRGFRIELGEIEAVLCQHPQISQAIVIATEDIPGDKRLVAYLVSEQPAPSISELRSFLQRQLPDYMIPSIFMLLPALPLTPNGKVDRRSLPLPEQTRPELEASFVAPRNPVEEELARIWTQVLKLAQVGVHDNFFELGGHSLLATQVISRVGKAFQLALPLSSLFEMPTIAGLAETLVKHEKQPGQVATIAQLRQKINSMSAQEIQAALQAKKRQSGS